MKRVLNERRFAPWVVAAMLLGICSTVPKEVHAAANTDAVTGVAAGRWASNDHVAMTSAAKAGSQFFLDIVLAADGSFTGSWERYDCFNYPGPYGIVTVACQRSRKGAAASGRLDTASKAGQIELIGLGKSSLRFKAGPNQQGQPQLDIELPREWLQQDAPVLYETRLNRR